ncbi:serine/arginine repetitive matrix protein 2-like isoform X2 [Penaeus japonicus]|uniref:serine/arginine repetitive matrix protein 2-like isoform X2 n=1 Tax=Penaeus japonicus TaxID=27405 RepID=UPI001C71417E|nr:serine/arginine repetitive matrix protein 2-like isoform X2 [Penaeus japonicus]
MIGLSFGPRACRCPSHAPQLCPGPRCGGRAFPVKVPSKDSSPGDTESRFPVSVDSRGRVAGEATAASGVGVGSSTTPPTVYASERSPPRAGSAGAGAKCHRDYQTPVSQPDKRANHAGERGRGDTLQMQQVSSSCVAENVAGVPCQSGGNGVCGVGGARARDNTRPASFVLGDSAQNNAVRVPMSLDLDGSSDDRRNQRSNGSSAGSRPRPTSLDINHESSLLRDLRKVSPVDALKDHFLKRMTPTSECSSVDTDVHYIPVELEASKTLETNASARGATAPQGTLASGRSLCERRGKGIENLVIKDDTYSSDGSSRVSSNTPGDKSSSSSAGSCQDRDEQAGSWATPGHVATHKTATGNSSVLNIGPDPFQQHSSSVCGGADSRAQPDGIGSGSATGGSRTKPCPRLPSESDPDVDEIISKAERVIEETRRLSADIANSHPPENDLGREENSRFKREATKDTSKPRGFNLAPNIDTRCSPESNFIEVDEENEDSKSKSEDSEVIVEGCLSIPLPRATTRPRQPRITPPPEDNVTLPDLNAAPKPARRDSLVIEAVDDVDDVTACEEVQPTIVTSPEIQSSDVMVCARESGRGGRTEAPPSPREARPRTLAHETQPTRAPRRPSSRERMGGVFSRGRTDDSTRQHPPAASGAARSKTVSPPPQTPPTPTRRTRERSFTPQEEQPPPPYVRQKAEPSRRYSGFGHVQSDNVRKMRDIWGTKQETSPQPPQRGIRVPASPPPSGRRAPDSPRRSSCSRSTPTREAPLKSPTRTNNFYSSTISSRNRSSSSPRRGSASSTDGGAPFTRDASRNTSAAANSSRAPQDKYNLGGSPGGRASPVRTPRTPRRTATPPPPPPPSEPPPASPFHHKVFRRLRDASLQPDSETICFTEEEDRYKLVMDVEEYVAGEIEVLQDDKALTVKGRVETKQGSSTSTRTFCRNFHIPNNTREEDIDSALSKDGILTVYVPKKKERVIKIELTD